MRVLTNLTFSLCLPEKKNTGYAPAFFGVIGNFRNFYEEIIYFFLVSNITIEN